MTEDAETGGAAVFLVCVEPAERATAPGPLRARLDAWRARRGLGACWLVSANTTSRILYDTLADCLGDRDRLLVSELHPEALSFNLRAGAAELARPPGWGAPRLALAPGATPDRP